MDPAGAHDVIVVGAGSSGAVLAARLSDRPGRRVLLLEAGPAYTRAADVPPEVRDGTIMAAAAPGHPLNWSLTSTVAPGLRRPVPRGRVAGGSGAVNGGVFVRATPADFDAIAAAGHPEWSHRAVLASFTALEADHDFTGPGHGTRGPVPVRRIRAGEAAPVTTAFLDACAALGLPEEADKNADGPPGAGPLPLNVVGGVRHSALLTHLLPRAGRSGLTVLGGATVHRVRFRGTRAAGVDAVIGGRPRTFHAPEVVLSAGAVGTPRLLLLSGIGPGAELAAHGIPVVHAAPGVGKRMSDHPSVAVGHLPRPGHERGPDTPVAEAALHTAAPGGGAGIELMPHTAPFHRLIPVPGAAPGPEECAIGVQVLRPARTGTVALASADPREPPVLSHGHLTAAADRARMRDGVRLCTGLMETAAFRAVSPRHNGPPPAVLGSDRDLDDWIRARLSTAVHLSGGCAMGDVADAHGRVLGVEGLRVCDTSLLPRVPARGTGATAMAIGEHLARLIDAEP
ncbi:mycofactocin system GMC family oxidoreductase MftG [Nocardiopsis sediminis]|uniref:Mycofactocin system GMC family oxidoreductase MftG n=1 Tax=Nocardiopsis sediminis TaxID=1778267 RepID=A0ABV8FJD9_9ACTN